MTTLEVLYRPQNINVLATNIEVLHRTQHIIVSPTDNSVTIVNAGPMGPKGATGSSGIVIASTAPTVTDILWLDTTVNGEQFSSKVLSDMVTPYSYIGIADAGSSETDSVWKVTRINLIGTVESAIATNVAWANRLTATYT